MSSEPVIVPATQAYADAYFNGRPPLGFRGYVALLDGEVIGVGGLFREFGVPIVFSQMKPPMRPFRKACARAVRLLVELMDSTNVAVYATADENEVTSAKLLAKLGFVATGVDTEHGELLVRRK